jgi:hydroxymethylglutaryl-CoA lyase
MLEAMGFDTGIDLLRLLAIARELPFIVGHDVPGQMIKAGLPLDLHPIPAYVDELRNLAE